MRHAAIVAGGLHPVMGAQRVITPGQVLARIGIQVTERGRETVAAVLARCATKGPQRVLQPLGKCHVAFAAEDHMGMLEARAGKPEVIESVVEPFLVRIGMLTRTPRGRVATRRAWEHLGVRRPDTGALFDDV